ncbi:MAG: hypothetical protein K6C98_08840 [Treponema sp.]|nr:hypothetical protein [Treponema sp.]
MEKQRYKSGSKPFGRLLRFIKTSTILAILSGAPLNVFCQQVISQAQLDLLKIAPEENQKFFTKSDIKFEVLIPNTNANSIILQSSRTPQNVTMRTMRKSQDYNDISSTRLEFWFNFEKKGEYKIPPVSLLINNRRRSLSFEPITITDNPEFLLPRIVLVFPNEKYFYSDEPFDAEKAFFNAHVGEKIPFTVCLQYAVLLVQFDWELPTDSIFTCTKNYEILEVKYREKHISDELIPVADFEWTSLAEGQKQFPKIKLTATGYNGSRNAMQLPDFFIDFKNQAEVLEAEEETSFFDKSFELYDTLQKSGRFNNKEDDDKNQITSGISEEACGILAALRRKERNELFTWKQNVRDRAEFESELGITTSINEFYMGSYYIAVLGLILCIILFIIFMIKHRAMLSILTSGLIVFALVFFIFGSIQKNKVFGISKGAKITSIPEETAKVESKIGEGLRVQIVEEAGSWIYIQMGESGGWCKKTDVIYIN